MTTTTKEKLEALHARIAELEKANKPPEPFVPFVMPRFDPTENMTAARMFDRETLQRMFAAEDPAGLQADRRAFQLQQRAAASPQPQPVQRGSGWREPAPLTSPRGVALADKLVDAQDKIDRAERVQQFAKAAAVEQASKDKA